MGLSANAYAVIGVQIPTSSLFTPKPYKIGTHNHPQSMKFDPQTGKALWDSYQECILNNGEELYGEVAKVRRGAGSISIQAVNEGVDTEFHYLGRVTSVRDLCAHGGGSFMPCVAADLDAIKNALRNLLTPHDLWDESKFGIWAVGYSA